MSDLIRIGVWFGTVEIEQRPVCDAGRLGYESRRVWRDRAGAVQRVDNWSPPLCWLESEAPKKTQRPFWARLFGAV